MPDSSLYHYLKLTDLRPGNYRCWQKSVQLCTDLSRYDSALICVQQGYAANPRSGKLAVQYATLLARLKQVDAADSLLSHFLATDSSNVEVISKKIDLSFRKADQVIYWGERLLADSADVSSPYINLAYGYLNSDSITKCIWLANG